MLEPKPVDDGSELKKPGTTPETEQTKSDKPADQTEEKTEE